MAAVTELASEVGASAACQALCMPRASYYRDRRKTSFLEETVSRPVPARASVRSIHPIYPASHNLQPSNGLHVVHETTSRKWKCPKRDCFPMWYRVILVRCH